MCHWLMLNLSPNKSLMTLAQPWEHSLGEDVLCIFTVLTFPAGSYQSQNFRFWGFFVRNGFLSFLSAFVQKGNLLLRMLHLLLSGLSQALFFLALVLRKPAVSGALFRRCRTSEQYLNH